MTRENKVICTIVAVLALLAGMWIGIRLQKSQSVLWWDRENSIVNYKERLYRLIPVELQKEYKEVEIK